MSWQDGCRACENSIIINERIYKYGMCGSAPNWYGCKLNKDIMSPSFHIPPEKCPMRNNEFR